MKDYTKEIAGEIIRKMNLKTNYSENKMEVLTYGMELILNSLLKVLIYLCVGVMLGKFLEVVFAIIVFVILKKTSGGIHFEKDIYCFLVTGGIILGSVFSAEILKQKERLNIILMLFSIILYLRYAPCDEYYDENNLGEKEKDKFKSMMLVCTFFAGSILMNDYCRSVVTIVAFLEGLTLIKGGNKDEKSN